MKQTKLLILFLLVFAVGCTSKIPQDQAPPADFQVCISDADCIPQPGCHPANCINSDFKDKFEQPEMCTEIFMCNAAYSAEDCLCRQGTCINRYTVEKNPNCDVPPDANEMQSCPDEWIKNQMPGTINDKPTPNEYFIVNGERRELTEFDLDWIRDNCDITPQVVV